MFSLKRSVFFIAVIIIIVFSAQMTLYSESVKALDDALKQLQSAGKYYTKGLSEFHKRNSRKATNAFENCLNKMPQHAYAYYYLANLFYIQEDYHKSLSYIEQALGNFDFMQELNAYAAKQKVKQMDSMRETLEEMWDSTNSCRDSRAIEFAWDQLDKEEGDLELATEKRQKMVERMKAQYTYFHGNILYQLKQIPDAFRRYEEAIKLDPLHAGAYNNLIAICYLARQYPTALAFFEKAEEEGLDESLNLELKESLFKALGRPTEGILQEDLSTEEPGSLGIMRFALAFRQEKSMSVPLYVNCYIVYSPESRQAILIDPGVKDSRIEEYIRERNLKVKAILNTHDHADHTGANSYYAKLYRVPVCAPKDDAQYYDSPPDRLLEDEELLEYDGFTVQTIHTPGHSDGSLCFLIGDTLFSGDTLFKNDIGKVWTKEEKKINIARKKLIQNISKKLLVLPGKTRVFPGHGRTTTIADEKENNPLFNKK